MKFLVSRTSWCSYSADEPPPCEGTEWLPYLKTQIRTVKTFEEFEHRFGREEGPWTSRGRNHRVVPDGIARDVDAEGWQIELADLDALLAFIREYGHVVVSFNDSEHIPSIEIYDDYRE